MSTVTTTRRIDLTRLGHPATMRGGPDTGYEIDAPAVGTAALQAAVDACPDAPDPATLATNEATIRTQVTDHLADLRTITNTSGSLTNAQLANAVRVLARGQIRLIRLAVGLLDGTD